MKSRKLHVFALAVLLSALGGVCAQAQTGFFIRNWDGIVKSVDLSTLDKLTFTESDMVLNYQTGSTENIQMAAIQRIYFNSLTGLIDIQNKQSLLSIFPNPSSDFVSIRVKSSGKVCVSIFSSTGLEVMRIPSYIENDKIDISRLIKGIYIVKVGTTTLKFTKL